jgi:hypothetical protein
MVSSLAAAEPASKAIIVGEKIVKENPWRNGLIKKQYAIAVEQALKEHRAKHPKSKLRVIESFDEGSIQGFALAEREQALGVVGYLYSTEAFEASQIAASKKIPFLTPVSPLASVKNEFSYSMAASHDELKASFKALAKKLGPRSIVIMPETFLPNFEYERLYQEVFEVLETHRGSSVQVWPKIKDSLPILTRDGSVNILFAGLAFEQADLLKLLCESAFAGKVNLIGHSQWVYNEVFLRGTIPAEVNNFLAVSDYIDLAKPAAKKMVASRQSIAAHSEFKATLKKAQSSEDQTLDEPIVYLLKDMISIALAAAEKSTTREEYNRHYSNCDISGTSGHLKIKSKKPNRKVYLERWKNNGFIPETIL